MRWQVLPNLFSSSVAKMTRFSKPGETRYRGFCYLTFILSTVQGTKKISQAICFLRNFHSKIPI